VPAATFIAPDLVLTPIPDSEAFRGSYKGAPVKCALVVNHGDNCIILLDPDSSEKPRFENLFCLARDGDIVWTASLPETRDTFVELRFRGEQVVANSWSAFLLTIDPSTGSVLNCEFTK
jgi:hypothetical protein